MEREVAEYFVANYFYGSRMITREIAEKVLKVDFEKLYSVFTEYGMVSGNKYSYYFSYDYYFR